MSAAHRVTLDFAVVTTVEQAHDVLTRELKLPSHYGRNLDALWDCLTTDVKGPVEIALRNASKANPALRALAALLREAAAKRRDLRVIDD